MSTTKPQYITCSLCSKKRLLPVNMSIFMFPINWTCSNNFWTINPIITNNFKTDLKIETEDEFDNNVLLPEACLIPEDTESTEVVQPYTDFEAIVFELEYSMDPSFEQMYYLCDYYDANDALLKRLELYNIANYEPCNKTLSFKKLKDECIYLIDYLIPYLIPQKEIPKKKTVKEVLFSHKDHDDISSKFCPVPETLLPLEVYNNVEIYYDQINNLSIPPSVIDLVSDEEESSGGGVEERKEDGIKDEINDDDNYDFSNFFKELQNKKSNKGKKDSKTDIPNAILIDFAIHIRNLSIDCSKFYEKVHLQYAEYSDYDPEVEYQLFEMYSDNSIINKFKTNIQNSIELQTSLEILGLNIDDINYNFEFSCLTVLRTLNLFWITGSSLRLKETLKTKLPEAVINILINNSRKDSINICDFVLAYYNLKKEWEKLNRNKETEFVFLKDLFENTHLKKVSKVDDDSIKDGVIKRKKIKRKTIVIDDSDDDDDIPIIKDIQYMITKNTPDEDVESDKIIIETLNKQIKDKDKKIAELILKYQSMLHEYRGLELGEIDIKTEIQSIKITLGIYEKYLINCREETLETIPPDFLEYLENRKKKHVETWKKITKIVDEYNQLQEQINKLLKDNKANIDKYLLFTNYKQKYKDYRTALNEEFDTRISNTTSKYISYLINVKIVERSNKKINNKHELFILTNEFKDEFSNLEKIYKHVMEQIKDISITKEDPETKYILKINNIMKIF